MIDPFRFCTAVLNNSTTEALKEELAQLAKREHDVICVLRPKTFTYYDQIHSYHKSQSDETMLLTRVNAFEGQTDFFNAPGIECIKFTGKIRST